MVRRQVKTRSTYLRLGRGVLAGLIGTLCVIALARTDPWQSLEARAQGTVLRDSMPEVNDEVFLVAIDDATYRRLNHVLYRKTQAALLDALSEAGAKVVAYDVFFSSPARDGAEADQAFADALRRYGRAIVPIECAEDPGAPPLKEASALSTLVDTGAAPALPCESPVLAHPPIAPAAHAAHLQLPLTASGHAQGVFALADAGGRRVLSLSAAAFVVGEGLSPEQVVQKADALVLGDRTLALSDFSAVRVSHRPMPYGPDATVSFADLEQSVREHGRLTDALAARVRGRYVFIGLTSKASGDNIELPTGDHAPAVLMHLSALSDLLEGRRVRELPFAHLVLVLLALCLVMSIAATKARPLTLIPAMLMNSFAILYGVRLLAEVDVLAGPLAPLAVVWLSAGGALATRLVLQERERHTLEVAFRTYVDGAVLERILQDPDRFLALGGARKRVSILFADIQGYTHASNTLPTESVLGLLREYLEVMTSVVREAEGRVDKIMGDGILAVFGDPIPLENHARRAIEVGLRMQEAVSIHRERWGQQFGVPVRIRIGIATGEVFVGNVGAPGSKIEYTVLGAAVNLAARLEANSPVGSVLICEATREEGSGGERAASAADGLSFEPVEGLNLKGFNGPQRAFIASRALIGTRTRTG